MAGDVGKRQIRVFLQQCKDLFINAVHVSSQGREWSIVAWINKQKGLADWQALFADRRYGLLLLLALGGSYGSLEGGAGGELGNGCCRNLDLFARLRVLAFAGGARGGLE